jgi:predicted Zn-dependent peptidase
LSYDDEDRIALLLVNTVLSGGMSSRLHQNIREKYGYCYSVSSFSQSYSDSGMFGVYIGTDKEYIEHVRELIRHEFEEMQAHLVPEKEWLEVKSQLKGKLLLAQESMNNRMTRLAKSELYYDRFITLDELVEEIDEISREAVRAFSEKFLDYSDYSELLLIPEKSA